MNTNQPYDLVIGLGKSGLSMARFLHSQGRRVIGTDINPEKEEAAKTLELLGIETHIGFHDQECFNNADRMIPSPGIPLTVPYIHGALEKSVPIKSELDIFYEHNQLTVIAITGTNGKTTTTTLLGEILSACGYKPFVCGNIGTPLVELFLMKESFDLVVAEVSSFQMDISEKFRADVGVLLNISEDHLDRYDDFSDYERSKWRFFENQTSNDTAVINQSINDYDTQVKGLTPKAVCFSSNATTGLDCQAAVRNTTIDICIENTQTQIETAPLKGLPGIHNHENIAAALLAGMAIGADLPSMVKALPQFKPMAHRIEYVTSINGIDFFNDSKATNTDAVIRAIQSFGENIILILGGREKSTDFNLLKNSIQASVKLIVALGETRQHIHDLFKKECPISMADSMDDAVQKAYFKAVPGDTVLLSPACASFDMYDNYAQRGLDFIDCVKGIEKKVS